MPSSLLPSLSETLKLQASMFFRLDLATPWGLELPKTTDFRIHILQRGGGILGGNELGAVSNWADPAKALGTPFHSEQVELQEGDIVFLKGGQAHWIADRPGRPLLSTHEAVSSCGIDRPPFQTGPLTHRLICGRASVDDRGGGWLLSLLPEVIHFRRDDLDERVWKIVEAIGAKSTSLESDDAVVLNRLTEALFLCLLAHAMRMELEVGRLGAAQRDPSIQKVLVLMHTRMNEAWTIQKLAEQAGMSRAALARRFKLFLEVPVMDYLHRVRMARAMQSLLDGASLGEVAAQVGYASSEPFRKAFKQHTGKTPAQYLRAS